MGAAGAAKVVVAVPADFTLSESCQELMDTLCAVRAGPASGRAWSRCCAGSEHMQPRSWPCSCCLYMMQYNNVLVQLSCFHVSSLWLNTCGKYGSVRIRIWCMAHLG